MIVLFLSLTFGKPGLPHHHRDLGYAGGATSWHRLAGALAASSAALCNCVVFTYFIATENGSSTRSWSKGSIRKSRCPRARSKPPHSGRPGLVTLAITTAIIGAAVDNQYFRRPGITPLCDAAFAAIWALLSWNTAHPR